MSSRYSPFVLLVFVILFGYQNSSAQTDLTLEQAESVLAAAHTAALTQGTAMNIAVVDRAGQLTAFARMDGSFRGSIDIAIRKARTSALFPLATGDIGGLSQPGQPLYNIELSNDGLISFGGGLPILDADGNQIGAIGVSGSTVEDDIAVAQAGISGALAPLSTGPNFDTSTRLGQSWAAIEAAKAEAVNIAVPMDIAVTDADAKLNAFVRMDGAFRGSIDIAIKKARTSTLFSPLATAVIGTLSQPGQSLYQIEVSNGGLISFGGGIPLVDAAGTPSGAIGVSTGSVEQDAQVAMAGVVAFEAFTVVDASPNLNLEQALTALAAAQTKAAEQGTLMNIAVVDAGGNLKAFTRADGSFLGSIDIAMSKAKTSALFSPLATGDIGALSQPGQPLYYIELSNDGLVSFDGGLPLTDSDGNVIGAVGVSGSSVEDDREAAQAAVDAVSTNQVMMPDTINGHEGLSWKATYAAMTEAESINVPMDIATVDTGADLQTFVRMDGAFLGSIDIAIKKATTSALFAPLSTGQLGALSQPGQPLYRIELSNDRLITFPGGRFMTTNCGEEDFGAIGVSTGTVEEDDQVAAAGEEAIFCSDPMVSIIHTTDASMQIQVMSNPFSNQVLLQTANSTGTAYDILIYDMQGKQFYSGSLNGNLQINTSDWASGMYLLKVMYNGQLVGKEKLMRMK